MSQVIKFPPRMDDIPGQLRDMVRQLGLVEILRQIMCNIALDDD